MRPALAWTLAASLVLAAVVGWWPQDADDTDLLPAGRAAPRADASTRRATPPASPAPGLPGPAAAALAPGAPPALAPMRPMDPLQPRQPLRTTREAWPAPDLAVLLSWQGAPLPAPAAPRTAAAPMAPAAPAAPVFAYRWIGQFDDGSGPQALLASARRSQGVRSGGVVDGQWRVDLAPGQRWSVTHLPTATVADLAGAPPPSEP